MSRAFVGLLLLAGLAGAGCSTKPSTALPFGRFSGSIEDRGVAIDVLTIDRIEIDGVRQRITSPLDNSEFTSPDGTRWKCRPQAKDEEIHCTITLPVGQTHDLDLLRL